MLPIAPEGLENIWQFHYLAAYLEFWSSDDTTFAVARSVADYYNNDEVLEVTHWRKLFQEISEQLAEIDDEEETSGMVATTDAEETKGKT